MSLYEIWPNFKPAFWNTQKCLIGGTEQKPGNKYVYI